MKTWKLYVYVGFVAIIVFTVAFVACEPETTPNPDPDLFEGIWVDNTSYSSSSISMIFVAANGIFSFCINDIQDVSEKGTYTVSGNTVSLTTTHNIPFGETSLQPLQPSVVNTGTLSGNTFIYNQDGNTFTFIKQQ